MIIESSLFVGGVVSTLVVTEVIKRKSNKKGFEEKLKILGDIISGKSHSPLALNTGDENASAVIDLVGSPEFVKPSNKEEEAFNKLLGTVKNSMEEEKRVIGELTLALSRMARGELDTYIGTEAKNPIFVGLISEVVKTKETLQAIVSIIDKGIAEIKKEDYTHDYDYSKELFNELKNVLSNMTGLSKELSDRANVSMKNSIFKNEAFSSMNGDIEVLAQNANKQASSLEETATAIEEISGNLNETNTKNNLMLKEANNGLTNSKEGLSKLEKTNGIVEEINEYQSKIEEAIKVIDQIAFQTNILSLNAAVEAATAGEHGKGFAVVAQEVRNLAAKSGEAANEIKTLVTGSITKAKEGSSSTFETLASFNKVVENIETTRDLVQEVATSSEETVVGINQINNAVSSLDSFTQQNASLANSVKDKSVDLRKITNEETEEVMRKKTRKN